MAWWVVETAALRRRQPLHLLLTVFYTRSVNQTTEKNNVCGKSGEVWSLSLKHSCLYAKTKLSILYQSPTRYNREKIQNVEISRPLATRGITYPRELRLRPKAMSRHQWILGSWPSAFAQRLSVAKAAGTNGKSLGRSHNLHESVTLDLVKFRLMRTRADVICSYFSSYMQILQFTYLMYRIHTPHPTHII